MRFRFLHSFFWSSETAPKSKLRICWHIFCTMSSITSTWLQSSTTKTTYAN